MPAAADLVGDLVEQRADASSSRAAASSSSVCVIVLMCPSWLLAGSSATPAGVEDAQARRVSRWWMIRYDSDAASSLAYSSLFGRAVAVAHRVAGVEQQVADEVRLLLVLLDGVALGLRP